MSIAPTKCQSVPSSLSRIWRNPQRLPALINAALDGHLFRGRPNAQAGSADWAARRVRVAELRTARRHNWPCCKAAPTLERSLSIFIRNDGRRCTRSPFPRGRRPRFPDARAVALSHRTGTEGRSKAIMWFKIRMHLRRPGKNGRATGTLDHSKTRAFSLDASTGTLGVEARFYTCATNSNVQRGEAQITS
jgi:hypothetical protein